jgi:hypothetical protein
MQGEALLKIGGILEKLSNDITILKNNSIEISGGNTIRNSSNGSRSSNRLPKPRSRSKSKKMTRPILRSTSQRRKANPTKRVSLKKKQVKRNSKPKSSTKKNNKKR